MSVVLLAATAILLTLYVVLPLYKRQGSRRLRIDRRAEEIELLVRHKNKLYADIRDLDFEFGIGKMAEQDYQTLRSEAIQDVAEVMRKLDAAHHARGGNGHVTDSVIEQWILSRRKATTDAIEVVECPTCREKSVANAKFCMHCGGPLR